MWTHPDRGARQACRGLTLIELLSALTVMTLIIGSLATLSSAVAVAQRYSAGNNDAVQHARVTLDRIARSVQDSYATDTYPGISVVPATVSGVSYPQTLVVWKPSGSPANANGPPLVGELVIYTPNPSAPNQLLEVTLAGDTTAVAISSASALKTQIDGLVQNTNSKKTVLTNLVRTAAATTSVTGNTTTSQAAVRFVLTVTPSTTAYTNYKAGSLTWANMSWPLYHYGETTGTRQVWVRTELQLNAGPDGGVTAAAQDVIPFLGSAVHNYLVHP